MNKKIFTLLLYLMCTGSLLYAQQNKVVSVNPLTGTASVVIPITSISSGAISVPVNLVYVASGVKVKDVESEAGMGWQLSAQGQISRQVRGLPDDCKKDNAGNTLLGWLYNSNGGKINSFTIANVNNSCTQETTDLTYLNSNFSDYSDTEPDIYNVNAPGLSFQFTFDASHNVQILSHEDARVTSTTDAAGLINAFTVVNDKGIKYNFTVFDVVRRRMRGTEANVIYFKTEFEQYKNSINYNGTWYLTSIVDPNFNTITYNYVNGIEGSSLTNVNLYVTDPSPGTPVKKPQYIIQDDHQPQKLMSIKAKSDSVVFSYYNNVYTSQSFINSISAMGKTFQLMYDGYGCLGSFYTRYFLTGIQLPNSVACSPPAVSYSFSYATQKFSSSNGGIITDLPDSSSTQIDYWGYYNGRSANTSLLPSVLVNPSNIAYQRYAVVTDSYSRPDYIFNLTGNDRAANPDVVAAGALNQITYNDNASTSIIYESNDYYDPSASAVVKGGGVRAKQIIDYDGIDPGHNIVRNYSYLIPGTTTSSGKPVSLPQYAFTRPYSGSGTANLLWNYSTIRSELDLSNEDHSIIYSNVNESQVGAGSTLYEYYTPATNWDLSVSPDWAQTMDYSASPGCVSVGLLQNNNYSYPFAPNPNYDFERGLIKKVTNYDGSNVEVSEKNYTYTRTNAPTVIKGLMYDDNSFAKGYAKYNILANTSKLVTTLDEKVFDSQAQNHNQETVTSYTYASLYHKLLTSQAVTNSNGITQTIYYKYSKDYVISSTADPNVNALYQLQQQNINIPIESYVQIGSKYTSGQILKLHSFNFTMPDATIRTLYLPSQKLQFLSPDGASSFTPSAIVSNLFQNDSKYYVAENDLQHDNAGYLQTKDDNNKHVSTVLTDPNIQLPIASVTNAAVNEIGFDNFSNPGFITAFAPTDGIYTYDAASRNGGRSFDMAVGKVLTKTVNKTVNAKNYIFSIWIKSGSSSGNLSLTLGAAAPVSLAFTSTGTNWQYFEYKVPVTAMGSAFSVSFQSSAAIVVDDISFYPENAQINSTEYDYTFHNKYFDTNTNGVSVYYKYDLIGRPTLTYDQDFNMVQRKTYVSKTQVHSSIPTPSFTISSIRSQAALNPVTFTSTNYYTSCDFPDLTYTWDFGDGSGTVTDVNPTHTYATYGSFTVTVTASATGFSPVSVSKVIKVIPPPVYVTNDSEANPGTGDFRYIKFYKAGVLIYTFSSEAGGDNIPFNSVNALVDRDVYDIVVSIDGIQFDSNTGNGYTKLVMHTDTTDDCRPYTHSGQFTFTGVDLTVFTSELSFHIGITPCP